ncbi:hypothetical protein K6119_09705 [Paracrocinitomix mangrovi]|uniref:hypothetical protein n=1 Tax=Paracrocinitomix mangrovi TaxID=2862509 RepID=UPI001C8EFB18|nr:hypothetical protein [Paracrocinitomix mangrovi]UKN03764.1 hypothetical protein K6119_09705 [Paracrocinitomix mangrovi]
MSNLILETNGSKSIWRYIILWVAPPFTIILFLTSVYKPIIWLFLLPFVIVALCAIYFKSYRIKVFNDKVVKEYLIRKKKIERSSSKIKFRMGDYYESRGHSEIVIINCGNELIGTIEFSSFSKLEKFVEQTLKSGDRYVWNKTMGNGDVYDKIKFLINKYQSEIRV